MGDQNHNLHLFEEFLVLRGAVEQVFRLPVAGEWGQDVAVLWRQKRTLAQFRLMDVAQNGKMFFLGATSLTIL